MILVADLMVAVYAGNEFFSMDFFLCPKRLGQAW
jgi:hypothetical protein